MHTSSVIEQLLARKAEVRADSERLRCELRRNAASLRPAMRGLEFGRDLLSHTRRGMALYGAISRFWKH
jgi:hypothetical protein